MLEKRCFLLQCVPALTLSQREPINFAHVLTMSQHSLSDSFSGTPSIVFNALN